MLPTKVAAALRSDQPSTFEYRDKERLFYVTHPALGFPLEIPAETFFENVASAVECARQYRPWRRPSAEIIDFRAHQAAASGNSGK